MEKWAGPKECDVDLGESDMLEEGRKRTVGGYEGGCMTTDIETKGRKGRREGWMALVGGN